MCAQHTFSLIPLTVSCFFWQATTRALAALLFCSFPQLDHDFASSLVCIHAAFLCVPALLRFFVFTLLLSVRSWSGRFSPPEAPTALPHCQGVLSRLSLSLSGVQQSRAQQRIPSQCVGLCGQESV